ncbi:hypothetical protein M0805_008569 [Coniferiporia weirii]|nr:hypothetical protein M0805_008569 [Coniferiporia weirii]
MASSSSSNSVSVAPTTLADLPALVECEMLAFTNLFASLLFPLRASLLSAGVHPRLWPDFHPIVRIRTRELRDGMLLFTAFVPDDGDGARARPAGFVVLQPSRAASAAARANRTWAEALLADYVYPTMDAVQDKIQGALTGVDGAFWVAASEALEKGRNEFASERDCYVLRTLAVHPQLQRRGIGSALLAQCSAVADATNTAIYLEASAEGVPLYTSHGFRTIRTVRIEYKDEVVEMPVMVREPATAGSGPLPA